MLPERLSIDLTSLNPRPQRLVIVTALVIAEDARSANDFELLN
jgi:exoribonuclease R